MCGISGIISKDYKCVKQEKLKQINSIIAHRGPDDEGFYFEKNFAFGHRRLAILDLSKEGHQPMHYLDNYTITYNGEIYNYLELKEELILDGYSFQSKTDTEVILASYDKWGEECVLKFNGMWAFAIYDKKKEIIFCSRDRFGIKPFYYSNVENEFIFGSEIKQIITFQSDRFANKDVVLDFLLLSREEHNDNTFFRDVKKLPQSCNLVYSLTTNEFEIKKYYNLTIDNIVNSLDETDSINTYRKAFEKAVELRLRADVKVGTCLSGGLDSSAIASVASKLYHKKSDDKFCAITAKSIEEKTDESHYAKKVVDYADLQWNTICPSTEDFIKNIDEVISTQEEPFGGPSVFMQYFVMKKAKEVGCTVMLDGQGGDETLVGYETYFPYYIAFSIREGKILTAIRTFLKMKNFKITRKRTLLLTAIILAGNKVNYLKKIYKSLKLGNVNLKSKEHTRVFNSFPEFQMSQIMELNLAKLLKYEDKNSMRHSIETRLPFVDVNVVEAAMSINHAYKVKHGYLKYILRKAIDGKLPHEITWRYNKFGFEAPTDIWINSLKDQMIEEVSNSTILKEYGFNVKKLKESDKLLLWRLFSIARWEKVYYVKA